MKSPPVWLKLSLASMALLSIGVAALVIRGPFNNPYNHWYFDSPTWKSQNRVQKANNLRGKMLDDLAGRVLKKGMTRAQVAALLGLPDGSQSRQEWDYCAGSWDFLAPDVDIFVVEFDQSGRVKNSYRFST